MLKKISIAASFLLGAVLFTACPGDDTCETAVTYESYVKTLVASKCSLSGCHDGTVGVPGNYKTFAGLKGNTDSGAFQTNVLEKNRMPLGQPEGSALPAADLEKLQCWADAGYPEK